MAQHIDVLGGTWGHVIADNTSNFVSFTPNGPGSDYMVPLYNIDNSGHSHFLGGDNGTILSIGITIPSICQIADTWNSFDSGGYTGGVGPVKIDVSGDSSATVFDSLLPFAPYEMSVGQYYNAPTGAPYMMGAGIRNVPLLLARLIPESYNGTKFNLSIFVKVAHNSPLVAAS